MSSSSVKRRTLPFKKPGANNTFCSLELIDVEKEMDELASRLAVLERKRDDILHGRPKEEQPGNALSTDKPLGSAPSYLC